VVLPHPDCRGLANPMQVPFVRSFKKTQNFHKDRVTFAMRDR
jgi:hypothetical protein